ncbi:MAG: hypothetical protein GY756_13595 [bacterium]|nr:hypothetical protein [bacterium]
MSNKILQELTAQNIENLKLSFSTSKRVFFDNEKKKIFHAGEYGLFRERAVIELLRLFTPQKFGIGTGFVITDQGDISTQCDIVVYDLTKTPNIVTDSHQSFFPIETVVAVGEVKSDIKSKNELNNHLEKLAKIKSYREKISDPSIYYQKSKGKFVLIPALFSDQKPKYFSFV